MAPHGYGKEYTDDTPCWRQLYQMFKMTLLRM